MITIANIVATFLVVVAGILGFPFAVLGFLFQFVRAAFETGQGAAAGVSTWISSQDTGKDAE